MKKLVSAGALLGLPAILAVAAVTVLHSDASWRDDEWVLGSVGVVDCSQPDGRVAGAAEGRMLSGGLVGADLDTVAALRGVRAETDGNEATVLPSSASPVAGMPDAWINPLDVSVLGGVVGMSSSGIQVPLDTPAGVVAQFAQAHATSDFLGASGAISDSGLLALDPATTYPSVARVDLLQLVNSVSPALTAPLSAVASVRLDVGAVAARAGIDDACTHLFTGGRLTDVQREYLMSHLDTVIESPLVSAVAGDMTDLVDRLQATVDGLATSTAVTNALIAEVTSLASVIPPSLRLGTVTAQLEASIDVTAVRSLIQEPVSDSRGVLQIRPVDGSVAVDVASLLGAAFPGQYSDQLNGLDPNSSILTDPAILTTLEVALGEAMTEWTTGVQSAINQAIAAIEVSLTATLDIRTPAVTFPPLPSVSVATVTATLEGSLEDLLAGNVPAETEVDLLGVLNLALLDPLTASLEDDLGAAVGEVVAAALDTLPTVIEETTVSAAALTGAVSLVYRTLFLDGVVNLTINAQNSPALGGPPPGDWSSLPPGRYDVAALRVAVLDAAPPLGAHIYLGRASVGPLCFATSSSGC